MKVKPTLSRQSMTAFFPVHKKKKTTVKTRNKELILLIFCIYFFLITDMLSLVISDHT